jgi:PRTRC genetic system protein B
MECYVELGGSEDLTLKGAVLVYRGGTRCFASWHDARVAESGGAPFLGEGKPLTTAFVQALAEGLGARVSPEILPERVLVRTPEMIVWWSPAQVRTMFFGGADEKAKQISGARFPHPPLVWKVSGRELWVRAMTENGRPTAATALKTAPYYNVSEQGLVCQGTMRAPDEIGTAAISFWEKAFFESEFTHVYGAARLTNHPGGCLGLWASIAGKKRSFPSRYLTDARESLRQFAERS